jgi:hypothetical protein
MQTTKINLDTQEAMRLRKLFVIQILDSKMALVSEELHTAASCHLQEPTFKP